MTNTEAITEATTTDTTTVPAADQVYALARDQGAHLEFLNVLATVKADGGTGSMSAVEFLQPRGFGPPLHCHRDEDEIVIVLDGEVAFRSGDDETVATTGAFVNLPHGIPHTFQVLSETARMLSITAAAGADRPRFDEMVRTLGAPTTDPVIPAEREIDPGHVAMVNGQLGIDILGPPPAPLP